MTEADQQDTHNFLYPRSRYRGQFTPQNLVFDANLQELARASHLHLFAKN